MQQSLLVRPLAQTDFDAWQPLWDGYNAFYGRADANALDPAISASTWARFFDPQEPVFALVAEREGRLVGLSHYLFHRSTARLDAVCYLQDLFTAPAQRGLGVGRALIRGVSEAAQQAGIDRVYWHTHESNAAGRQLYDKVGKHGGFIVYVGAV